MKVHENRPVTHLLRTVGRGNRLAADELIPLVYCELLVLATSWLRKLPKDRILQPTALVHEAYLRLAPRAQAGWENRRHFFFAAARAMHDVLVEYARRNASRKRGGDRRHVNVDDLFLAIESPAADLLALEEALERLKREDPRKHKIVRLRFFAGLTEDETAEIMDLSMRTVQREWRCVRGWLQEELAEEGSHA